MDRDYKQIATDLAKKELHRLMSDISEGHYCAGWLIGLEYSLWSIAVDGGGTFGMGDVEPETAARLKELADIAGGWWRWDDDADNGRGDEVFVPMDEWLRIWKEKGFGK